MRAKKRRRLPASPQRPDIVCAHSCNGSSRDGAPMQPVDRIERRSDGAFLPGRQVGSVFSREDDAAVESAQIVVVLGAGRLRPKTEATHKNGARCQATAI